MPSGALKSIASGTQTTCGLFDPGRVRCWGDNERAGVDLGLIGVPGVRLQTIDAATARDVDLGGRAIAISAGSILNCALRDDGRVFCWGMVDAGEPVGEHTIIAGAKETPVAFGAVKVFDRTATP
jgi:hypothetical protein